jgi:hypothetical protein
MSVDIKKDPAGAEWLFTRIEMRMVEKGRYSIDVSVFDEDSEVVALSRLMSLLIAPREGGARYVKVEKL